MNRMLAPIRTLAVIAALLVSPGCGDDVGNEGDLVGGACDDSSDCAERCEQGDDFPSGTCTVACVNDDQCPGGTHCVDVEGGICLLACGEPSDCRGGYNCKGETNRGHGGDSLVCIRD